MQSFKPEKITISLEINSENKQRMYDYDVERFT
jgi:hypothetical protein